MKVVGLNGVLHNLKFGKYYGRKSSNASKLHKEARILLKNKFPVNIILEEVILPGSSDKRNLSADFFIVDLQLIVEVHGEQHYKFNSLYYKTMSDFYQAKRRDRDKKEWADINGITLIVLPFNEKDKWEGLINGRYDT